MSNNTDIIPTIVRPFRANKILNQIYKNIPATKEDLSTIENKIQSHFGISKKQLTYWLQNIGIQPSIEQFTEMAQLLGCTVDDLIETSPAI